MTNSVKNIKGLHYAYYGSLEMQKAYCSVCESSAFVIDGKLLCCDSKPISVSNKIEIVVEAKGRRKRLSKKRKEKILQDQNNCCLYCQNEFGIFYRYKNKVRITKLEFDHMMPFSYNANSSDDNRIASCNICNSIKGSNIFNTIEEIRNFIKRIRKDKGYIIYNEKPNNKI